jgi:hypothetical protein
LRKDVSLSRADLDEWRLINQQHDLSVG